MKKESLELFWLRNKINITEKLEKSMRYRDCAFSALAMLENIAYALCSKSQIIAIATYMVLLFRLYAEDNIQVYAHCSTGDLMLKQAKINGNDTFSQFVQKLDIIEISHEKHTVECCSASLELTTIKNKLFFCFESLDLSIGEYIAATIIQRYRDLLIYIQKNPHSKINSFDITTSKEKKIFEEWHQAHLRHEKSKNALHIIEQQIALMPIEIAKQYSQAPRSEKNKCDLAPPSNDSYNQPL